MLIIDCFNESAGPKVNGRSKLITSEKSSNEKVKSNLNTFNSPTDKRSTNRIYNLKLSSSKMKYLNSSKRMNKNILKESNSLNKFSALFIAKAQKPVDHCKFSFKLLHTSKC